MTLATAVTHDDDGDGPLQHTRWPVQTLIQDLAGNEAAEFLTNQRRHQQHACARHDGAVAANGHRQRCDAGADLRRGAGPQLGAGGGWRLRREGGRLAGDGGQGQRRGQRPHGDDDPVAGGGARPDGDGGATHIAGAVNPDPGPRRQRRGRVHRPGRHQQHARARHDGAVAANGHRQRCDAGADLRRGAGPELGAAGGWRLPSEGGRLAGDGGQRRHQRPHGDPDPVAGGGARPGGDGGLLTHGGREPDPGPRRQRRRRVHQPGRHQQHARARRDGAVAANGHRQRCDAGADLRRGAGPELGAAGGWRLPSEGGRLAGDGGQRRHQRPHGDPDPVAGGGARPGGDGGLLTHGGREPDPGPRRQRRRRVHQPGRHQQHARAQPGGRRQGDDGRRGASGALEPGDGRHRLQGAVEDGHRELRPGQPADAGHGDQPHHPPDGGHDLHGAGDRGRVRRGRAALGRGEGQRRRQHRRRRSARRTTASTWRRTPTAVRPPSRSARSRRPTRTPTTR